MGRLLLTHLTDLKEHGCHNDPSVKAEGPDNHRGRAIGKERQWEYQRILYRVVGAVASLAIML